MNKYKNIQKLNDKLFRRKTGVKKKTFETMLEILLKAEEKKKLLGGKPNYLAMEDRLLMCLEYMREYRTYFHIAQDYGISESTCFRNCVWIENILIKSKEFKLPSRKEMINNHQIEVITVDATESPVERPKKNKENTIPARKRSTP
jgi:hypothetical protein